MARVGEGSSPLTRGKLPRRRLPVSPSGLIPTHAGKTPQRRRRSTRQWAHPHSRGENRRKPEPEHHPRGSSPLTRGKPSGVWSEPSSPWLIPTHAGKTPLVPAEQAAGRAHPHSRGENRAGSPSGTRRAAHPHSRGENAVSIVHADCDAGSSPLTRGKRRAHGPLHGAAGLIPTHAGKTAWNHHVK